MSIQDGQELRERLGDLLGGLEPRPAPVIRAIRQGRGIKMRRLISAAAGLAVVAVGVVVIPLLLQRHTVSPAAKLHYKVTVEPVGKSAPRGLIGHGVADGKHWSVNVSGSRQRPMITLGPLSAAMAAYTGPVVQGWPADLTSQSGGQNNSLVFLSGTVSRNVTRIAISLPDGELLSLIPVTWKGYRWVAVAIPARVHIVRAVAYAGSTELGYAVPFGNSEFATWWRPGQAGPARLAKSIGAGVVGGVSWRYEADLGPWGYCYLVPGGSDCIHMTSEAGLVPADKLVSQLGCGPLGTGNPATAPTSGFAATVPQVLKVELNYSDGSKAAFPTVAVGRYRMFGYAIPGRLKVVRSLEYGRAGHLIGSTSGAGWGC